MFPCTVGFLAPALLSSNMIVSYKQPRRPPCHLPYQPPTIPISSPMRFTRFSAKKCLKPSISVTRTRRSLRDASILNARQEEGGNEGGADGDKVELRILPLGGSIMSGAGSPEHSG